MSAEPPIGTGTRERQRRHRRDESAFEERIEAVLLVVIAILLAVVAFLQFGQGRNLDSIAKDQSFITQQVRDAQASLDASATNARDANARSLLRNAAIAMESLYSDQQDFSDVPAAVATLEPNIRWVTDGEGEAAADQVAVKVNGAKDAYVLTARSESGTTYVYDRSAAAVVKRTCGPGCTW